MKKIYALSCLAITSISCAMNHSFRAKEFTSPSLENQKITNNVMNVLGFSEITCGNNESGFYLSLGTTHNSSFNQNYYYESQRTIEQCATTRYSPDLFMVDILTMQQCGDKKGLEAKLYELENSWDYKFGSASIMTQIFKLKLVLEDRATDLLNTIAHGTTYQAVEAIKDLRKLAPFKYQYPEYNNKNLSPEKYKEFYEHTVNEHVKQKGYNQLEAGEYLLQNRSDYEECRMRLKQEDQKKLLKQEYLKKLNDQKLEEQSKKETKNLESETIKEKNEAVNETGVELQEEVNLEIIDLRESNNTIAQNELVGLDFVTTTPSKQINFTIDELIQHRIQELQQSDFENFEKYQEAISQIINEVRNMPEMEPSKARVFLSNTVSSFFKTIIHYKDTTSKQFKFAVGAARYICDVAASAYYTSPEQQIERVKQVEAVFSALTLENLSNIPAEQWGEIVGTAGAHVVTTGSLIAFGVYLKGLNLTTKVLDTVGKLTLIFEEVLSKISSESQVLATTEGIQVGVIQEVQGLSLLKNAVENLSINLADINKKSDPLEPLDLGSTGRSEPANLEEQLAKEEIVSDPSRGMVLRLKKGMTDKRWPQEEGWVKMTWSNEGIEVHYVARWEEGVIKAIDDFKFITKYN